MEPESDTVVYIVDTSSFIEMKKRYPKDVFPTLWQRVDELIRMGRLIAPVEVKKEIDRGDDDLKKWVDSRKKMFVDPSLSQIDRVKEILNEFPSLAEPEKTS